MPIYIRRKDYKYIGFLITIFISIIVFELFFILSNLNITNSLFRGFVDGIAISAIFVFIDVLIYPSIRRICDVYYWVVIYSPIIGLSLAYFLSDTPYIMYGYLTGIILTLLGNIIVNFKRIF